MALPVAALISGGAALAGSITQSLSARATQKRQQKQDEKFWHMQNEYNSPQSQMKRFQEAGLNPNLIYGQSSGGAAGTAERLKTPDTDPAAHRYIDPQGIMSNIGGYADFEVKQAQTDNVKANTAVAQETALLTALKTYGEGLRNHRTKFDLNLVEDLRTNTMEMAKENLRRQQLENQFKITGEARTAAQAAENIIQTQLGQKLTEAQIQNLRADNELKELDKKLAAMGLRPNDPFYATAVAKLLMEKGWIDSVNASGQKTGKEFRQKLGF